ncbi:hypothetical protein Dimus_028684, partial [Dionaea muscipula]
QRRSSFPSWCRQEQRRLTWCSSLPVVLEGSSGRRTASACGGWWTTRQAMAWRRCLRWFLLQWIGGSFSVVARSSRLGWACSSSRRWVVMAVLSSFLGVGVADEQATVGGVAGGGEQVNPSTVIDEGWRPRENDRR